jgi:outer membrane protein assembly factor BamB
VRLSDGKEFWRYRVDEPGVRVHAPVTVAAGRVYIGAWEAFSIHGLDLGTGKPPAGYSNYSPTRGTKSPKLGLVQGMAVYRGLLVTASQKGSGSTLDANTGKLLASVHGMGSQLPTLPAFSGGKVYYQASPHGTALVDVLSKAKYKRKKSYKGQVGDAPLIGGNIMVVGTTAGGLHAYQLPADGVDEPAKQVWQWKSQSGKEIQTAPAAGSGFIVIGSDDGCVYAFSYSKEAE